jgi:hypothetical protein
MDLGTTMDTLRFLIRDGDSKYMQTTGPEDSPAG